MKVSLGIFEFGKLSALINGICLLVLIVLLIFFVGRAAITVIVLALVIGIPCLFVIKFLWTSKAQRVLLQEGVRVWDTKHVAIALLFPIGCTLAGVLTIVAYPETQIAILTLVVVSCYFGASLGEIAKIALRYRNVKDQ